MDGGITYSWEEIDSLVPWDENPRDITPEAFEGLRESIRSYGMPEPLVCNTVNRRVVGGHRRREAAKAEGWAKVPVCWVTIEDPAVEESLNVTLNNPKIQGTYNQDKLEVILNRLRTNLPPIKFEALKLSRLHIPSNWGGGMEQVEKTEANTDGIITSVKFLVPQERVSDFVAAVEKLVSEDPALHEVKRA